MLHGFPRGMCNNPKINRGATKVHGCDGVICPVGTRSDDGYATVDRACEKCPEGASSFYLGSPGCVAMTEEMILSMLHAVLDGDSWDEQRQKNWNDPKVSVCEWSGIGCDSDGELKSLSIPLVGASDL